MKLIYSILIVLLYAIVVTGCNYDKFEELYPHTSSVNPCDTSVASTYHLSIKYILAGNCISCHSTNMATGGVILDTYEGALEQAKKGTLMGAVLHKGGYQPMPPGSSLPQCQIEKLQQWMDAQQPQ
jgi:hypothetical protein